VKRYVEGKSSLMMQKTTKGITGGSSCGMHRRQNESEIIGELGMLRGRMFVGKCSSTYSSATVTHL
jgi:hypothetical protein